MYKNDSSKQTRLFVYGVGSPSHRHRINLHTRPNKRRLQAVLFMASVLLFSGFAQFSAADTVIANEGNGGRVENANSIHLDGKSNNATQLVAAVNGTVEDTPGHTYDARAEVIDQPKSSFPAGATGVQVKTDIVDIDENDRLGRGINGTGVTGFPYAVAMAVLGLLGLVSIARRAS